VVRAQSQMRQTTNGLSAAEPQPNRKGDKPQRRDRRRDLLCLSSPRLPDGHAGGVLENLDGRERAAHPIAVEGSLDRLVQGG
jgi:hypothetical protein